MPMISGKIAKIDDQQSNISGLEDVTESDDAERRQYINVTDELTINGNTVKTGLAVKEYFTEVERVDVNDDIEIGTEELKRKMWTRYWISQNDYVVVQNADGAFALDLVETAINGEVNRATIDIPQIIDDYPGQWMGAFDNRDDNVRSGLYFGDDIEDDQDLGEAFMQSDKNQIGPLMGHQGQELKLRVGTDWFQVLRPGDFTRREYLEFYEDIISQYVR